MYLIFLKFAYLTAILIFYHHLRLLRLLHLRLLTIELTSLFYSCLMMPSRLLFTLTFHHILLLLKPSKSRSLKDLFLIPTTITPRLFPPSILIHFNHVIMKLYLQILFLALHLLYFLQLHQFLLILSASKSFLPLVFL